MHPVISPFTATAAAYTAVATVHNQVYPDYPETPQELQFTDQHRDAKVHFARFIAVVDGEVVGVATYGQDAAAYHPTEFELDIMVVPVMQGKGVGKQLYHQLLQEVQQFHPSMLRVAVREDYSRARKFVAERGFVEEMREWESRSNPQQFDLAVFTDTLASVKQLGVQIHSLPALIESGSNWKQKLYQLHWEITKDIPTTGTPTQQSFEHFEQAILGNPNFLPVSWQIAVVDEQWIGLTALETAQAEPSLYVAITGVVPAWRRKGVATALKVAAMQYAKEAGSICVKTWNEQQNQGMLAINTAMGFVRQPAWIYLCKSLEPTVLSTN